MRRILAIAGALILFALASSSPAQQFAPGIGTSKGGAASSTGPITSLFSSAMTKPNFSAMMTKPSVPAPINLMSMLPSFPNLQNTMMLRNVFGPQTSVTLPKQATPPKKK